MRILVVSENLNLFNAIDKAIDDAGQTTLIHCTTLEQFTVGISVENYGLILSEPEFLDQDISTLINISNGKNSNIPFILLINDYEESQAIELLDFGVRDYLFKNNLAKLPSIVRHAAKDLNYRQILNSSKSYIELLSFEQINAALIAGKSIKHISNLILEGLFEVNGVDRSRIYLFDSKETKLNLVSERMNSDLKKRIEKLIGFNLKTIIPPLSDGSSFLTCIQENKPIITSDRNKILKIVADHSDNKTLKKLATMTAKVARINSIGIYPLANGNDVIGLLSISTHLVLTSSQKESILRYSHYASNVLSKLQNDELIKKNEEKFKAISNYTANWETWLNTEGNPIWINPGVYDLIGYTADELLAMPNFYLEIIHDEDLEKVLSTLHEGLINKTNGENFEFRCKHRNGSFPWFSVSWKQVFNAEQEWIGVRTSGAEITEKKSQEFELKKRDLQLSETERIAGIGTWAWNPETDQLIFNERFSTLIGDSQQKIITTFKDFLNLVHPESRKHLISLTNRSLNKNTDQDITFKLKTLDNLEKIILMRVSDQRKFDNDKTFIVGTTIEVTELTNSYKQLAESQNRFKRIFESIQDVYYQTCLDGKIMLISPSVKRVLGYEASELIDTQIDSLYLYPRVRKKKLNQLLEKETPINFETYFKTKKGKDIFVSINLSITVDENNKQLVQGLMRDISVKKKQELRLENQRKRLLEIVQLNTRIIETSDQFFYVLEVKKNLLGFNNPLKYVSPQVNRIVGVSEIDLLKSDSRWYSYIHPEDRKLVKDKLQALYITKQPVEVIYRIQNQKTKKYVWVNDYSCLQLDGNSEIYEVYGSIKDITDRQQAIEKIEDEKQQSAAFQYQLLGSQLNPHFIYNTLNSFQYYILKGDIESSLNHIAEFSTLMRTVLENSMHHRISLEDEMAFLKLYVKISKQRMQQPLDFELIIDKNIEPSEQFIPPMLLQPYVENSIIHGFANSKKTCKLSLKFELHDDHIHCIISDNGVGRAVSKKLNEDNPNKTKKSFAMGINQSRINLLNQITDNQFEVQVKDLYTENNQANGTEVTLKYNQITSEFVFINH